LLAPEGRGFEAAGVFNPAVVRRGNHFVMLYRAQDLLGTSTLGFATSEDGVRFTRRSRPVFWPQAPYERGGGVEDPRLAQFGNTFFLTYTAYNNVTGHGPNGKDAQLCLATSSDLIHWRRHGVVMPAYQGAWNIGWTKSGAIIQKRIGGRYWMYFLGDARNQPSQMGLAQSADLYHWKDATSQPVLRSRPGRFDSRVVEPGPPPLVTPRGILLIYNGADDRLLYSTGWVLFDRNEPWRVVARADNPIFSPSTPWEKAGQTPNVVFVEGLVRAGNEWMFYYGAADKYIGAAGAVNRKL
jgi:predicted GH43/DUF377 family glycosyl hydrolase